MVVLCAFFLLRDLEATTAYYQIMFIDVEAKRVAIQLPMSKHDPRALGCERA